MSKFFINRPIVAIVISILTVILGAITIMTLPVAQFPNIVPPEIQIIATFTGADAQTLEQSVAAPLEQQMTGVDNMQYMYSLNATASSSTTMTVDFDLKTDPNTDLMLAQSRETQAATQLPADVTNFGVTVRKSLSAPLMIISIYSPNGTYGPSFLGNYANINLADPISRSYGVGQTQVFGSGQYAMRLWVKPDQLAKLGITVKDIVSAIQAQNTVNPAGQVGAEPVPKGQQYTYSVLAKGRLVTPEEFGEVVVRESQAGGIVRVKDVARVELGAQVYSVIGRLNGKPAANIAVYQLPGSNAVQVVAGVKKLMADLQKSFPQDIAYTVPLDTTQSVIEGMKEIVITLVLSIALVIVVVYIFLQGWRATLIPALAVPVSLVGTFIFFPLFGFSINTISLLALVLAVGLVVDDAIVVVEAVERHIEDGLDSKAASLKAMEEISGSLVGIALVLSSVFIPSAFLPGITGRLYQQFAVTIAVSVILSAFNALTLSPALCALLLKAKSKSKKGLLQLFFDWFNRVFERSTTIYVRWSGVVARRGIIALVVLICFSLASVFVSSKVPSGFLPDEDQGYFYVNLQLPNASSLQRTDEVARKVEKVLAQTPGVLDATTVVGFSLLSTVRTSYNAFFFVSLKPWGERTSREEQYQQIKVNLNQALSKIPDGIVFDFSPPAIPGVGSAGGFTFLLEDRAGKDIHFLSDNLNTFMAEARKRPEIASLSTTFLPNVPQLYIDVDRDKVLKQGVPINDVYSTIQAFMGGSFINYFNRFGRQWQVYVEAEGESRTKAENVGQFYVRNSNGGMVPLSALTTIKSQTGPEFTMRFNEYRSAQINGDAAAGYSSAQAMAAIEQVFAKTMPREMGYDYMGMSYQEKKAQEGVSSGEVMGFSLLVVFLVLAALYESWSLPFSVLLSTPFAVFGVFAALWLRRTIMSLYLPPYLVDIENDIYSQIGVIMLIGLAAKNAILIVGFAKEKYESGKTLMDAALEGARLRFRPILMTSFAFILACIPLWTASGTGSVARRIIGTAVIGGMMASSFIAIFFIPAAYYLVGKISGADRARTASVLSPNPSPAEGD